MLNDKHNLQQLISEKHDCCGNIFLKKYWPSLGKYFLIVIGGGGFVKKILKNCLVLKRLKEKHIVAELFHLLPLPLITLHLCTPKSFLSNLIKYARHGSSYRHVQLAELFLVLEKNDVLITLIASVWHSFWKFSSHSETITYKSIKNLPFKLWRNGNCSLKEIRAIVYNQPLTYIYTAIIWLFYLSSSIKHYSLKISNFIKYFWCR